MNDHRDCTRMSRRGFLKAVGTSLAALQAAGCKRAAEQVVPYVRMPERLVPGQPKFYASIVTVGGTSRGVLVESHMGRPTRLQGNPHHPESRGALDAISQASIYSLYDANRSREVRGGLKKSSMEEFRKLIERLHSAASASKGEGLRILTGNVLSPCLGNLLRRVTEEFPKARWHQFEPISPERVYDGTALAFGSALNPIYDFSKADEILSIGGDFLGSMRGSLRYAKDFIARRKDLAAMPRLYLAEAGLSLTGARADKRLALHPSRIRAITECIAAKLGILEVSPSSLKSLRASEIEFCEYVHTALRRAGNRALAIPGEFEDPYVQALCHGMNDALGSIGATCSYTEPIEFEWTGNTESLLHLAEEMRDGKVETLIMLQVNPCFSAPADCDFAAALDNVEMSVHLGMYYDETAQRSNWHVPGTHELESWGDGRAFDGTASLQQPLIDPLFGGLSPLELIAGLLGDKRDAYSIVRDFWRSSSGAPDFEAWWRKSLLDGVIENTAGKQRQGPSQREALLKGAQLQPEIPQQSEKMLALVFCPDSRVWDGRFAENPWLQELPDPFTKITWDNALCVSPQTAKDLNLSIGQKVEIRAEDRASAAAVMIVPGLAPNVAQISLGNGRTLSSETGGPRGFNTYPLRTSTAKWVIPSIQLSRMKESFPFARAQLQYSTHERDLVRIASARGLSRNHPDARQRNEAASLYPEPGKEGYQWGMSIDLNACIGCEACVIACQAENNVPTVGKEEVLRGRRMHWLRVDRYAKGDDEDARYYFQPVPCMHCEYAPCELVCPVSATVHSPDGLNEQVYNRCVGTRYCSNNCPYKVRRFNFFSYNDHVTPLLAMVKNPNVTVRSRGVMEKCTYCVQRISAARIAA